MSEKIKRIFDILISLVLLILSSPFILIISLTIYISDKGEIFVKSPKRIGKGGKEFQMYKFRTMIPDAHNKIHIDPKYKKLFEKWKKQDGKLKISEDPRITGIGKILRKTDLDELPQLLNVIKGEMSLVGPRPMYKEEIDRYLKANPKGRKYLKKIFKIRPGMTGIWQVSGRNSIPFPERIKMDAKYSNKIDLWRDFIIFLKTPVIILTRKGAYE
ncbi:MAG: sugar transferase [Candidatus Dojkabacteria bacterium]|nr:sugar transferase [Candidatus Dojkabacteria bacterium]